MPKREAFLYHKDQRRSEIFWTNLIRDLRETNSVFGAALDAFMARGGVVAADQFAVISGAPLALKSQIASNRGADMLVSAGAIQRLNLASLGDGYLCARSEIGVSDQIGFRPRLTAESVILDAVREWVRKLGMADIDVLKVRSKAGCVGIECKVKGPGGFVNLDEVEDWLRRIPIFRAHLVGEQRFREAHISFEIWTTGSFAPESLALLAAEQPKRTKTPSIGRTEFKRQNWRKTGRKRQFVKPFTNTLRSIL